MLARQFGGRYAGVDKFHYGSCLVLRGAPLICTLPPTSRPKKHADSIGLILEGSAPVCHSCAVWTKKIWFVVAFNGQFLKSMRTAHTSLFADMHDSERVQNLLRPAAVQCGVPPHKPISGRYRTACASVAVSTVFCTMCIDINVKTPYVTVVLFAILPVIISIMLQ